MGLLVIAVSAASYAATAMNPLQETMRIALSLTDNQIAILQGPALAFPMLAAAIPLGFLIDRYSRVRLLLALTAFDILGGLLTAIAPDFTLLLAARCLIGSTALAVAPVGLSLTGDLFPAAQRGRAGMIMSLGQSAGVGAAFDVGGSLLKRLGTDPNAWRPAVLWLTAPLILVALTTLALKEPLRTGVGEAATTAKIAWSELWQYRTLLVPLLAGVVMGQIALGAVYVWSAPMLARRFALPPDRIGVIMATGLFFAGAVGSVLGGILADLCQRGGGPRRTLLALGIVSFLSVPLALFSWSPEVGPATALLLLFITLVSALSVMGTTVFIVAIPNEVRGLSMSLLTAACVVVGTGFAPMTVSLVAGELGGARSIGAALSWVCGATGLIGAAAFLVGRRFGFYATMSVPTQ